jgi:DNA uptake protein ComE-like DNA-binding protein
MIKLFDQKITGILLALFAITIVACGGNTEEESTTETNAQGTITQGEVAVPADKLNINTASGEEFQTIPNVGDKMEHEFEEYRPYVSIQQFRKEIGKYVDEDQVAAYEEYIYVPIHRNDSDAATLLQIPGLDENEAEELVEGRPYETNQDFFDALSSYISDVEMETAKIYTKAE